MKLFQELKNKLKEEKERCEDAEDELNKLKKKLKEAKDKLEEAMSEKDEVQYLNV